jgi:hypothetical protein
MNRIHLSKAAKELILRVAYGFKEVASHSFVEPWNVSYYFINDLKRFLANPEDLKGDRILFDLEMASGVSYSELKGYWDKLTIEEREIAIRTIIMSMASFGLISVVGAIAVNAEPSMREEILRIASRYYKDEISYNELVSELERVLWPTREERLKYWKEIEEYEKAMALEEYLPKEVVKEIIKAYFIEMMRLQMYDTYLLIPSVYPNFLE